jgi:hypothetical protein
MFATPLRRSRLGAFVAGLGLALAILPGMTPATASTARHEQRPCDIYAAGGTPCVAAHSTTRALYASYDGPLYQVQRASDGAKKDIGLLQRGGYADADAQDAFCAQTSCVITDLYDQSAMGNDLTQAPPGRFIGPAPGGNDNVAIADMAPVTVNGHKAYGVYIMPGMGYRNNHTHGIATGDQAEGIYAVVDGTHYDSGCCFDYGNASTTGFAEGLGTMETVYFGTATAWTTGAGPGPWVMADLEAGLYSGGQANGHSNPADPTVTDRFVTGMVNGDTGNHFQLRQGNAQTGPLNTVYDGPRPVGYAPMNKKGAILLGTGGDNGDGSAGTFYEGVMTSGYPSDATADAVQANIVGATYATPQLTLSPVTTFTPHSTQQVTETFTNHTGETVKDVTLGVDAPRGWTVKPHKAVSIDRVKPEQTVSATFEVRSAPKPGAGTLSGTASWRGEPEHGKPGGNHDREQTTTSAAVRDVLPIKINEVRTGVSGATGDSFVELYNASTDRKPIDISGWTLAYTPTASDTTTLATVPRGTRIPAGGHYLLAGPGYSGTAVPDQSYATVLVANAAAIALRDAGGSRVVDSLVYGSKQSSSSANGFIVSPSLAEGGCIAVAPGNTAAPGKSLIRVHDGADTDSNCADFASTTQATPGAANVLITS